MNLPCGLIIPSILVSVCLLAVSNRVPAQVARGKEDRLLRDDIVALQKKAREAQVRIRGNESESDQLKKAVKINEVASVKQILLRNGFTAKDLEKAKISLLTGGGKGGEDGIEITVTCCDPKEITIRRTLENFTKTSHERK